MAHGAIRTLNDRRIAYHGSTPSSLALFMPAFSPRAPAAGVMMSGNIALGFNANRRLALVAADRTLYPLEEPRAANTRAKSLPSLRSIEVSRRELLKLATLQGGSIDGKLRVVARDLAGP